MAHYAKDVENFRMPCVLYRKIVGTVVTVFFIGHQGAVLYFFKKGIFYVIVKSGLYFHKFPYFYYMQYPEKGQ